MFVYIKVHVGDISIKVKIYTEYEMFLCIVKFFNILKSIVNIIHLSLYSQNLIIVYGELPSFM